MTFTIPDTPASPTNEQLIQAAPDRGDFDALAAAFAGTGIVTGCAVAVVSNLTVSVTAGSVGIVGSLYNTVALNVTLATADVTNPRIDLIVVDSSGFPSKITGTAAQVPQMPSFTTTTQCLLAAVYVDKTQTVLVSTDITGKGVSVLGTAYRFDILRVFGKEMFRWNAAVAKRLAADGAEVLVIADSIFEGFNQSSKANRVIDKLTKNLQWLYRPGGEGWVPAYHGTGMSSDWNIVGAVTTTDLGYGIGRNTIGFTAAAETQYAYRSFVGDRYWIGYAQGNGVGRCKVATDPWTSTVSTQGVLSNVTTIAALSNNVALPTGTINVVSTTGFPAAGSFTLSFANGTTTVVSYTGGGGGGTQFTGCTGGAGTMLTGQVVSPNGTFVVGATVLGTKPADALSVTLLIGGEYMTGSFTGTTFTITNRATNSSIAVTHAVGVAVWYAVVTPTLVESFRASGGQGGRFWDSGTLTGGIAGSHQVVIAADNTGALGSFSFLFEGAMFFAGDGGPPASIVDGSSTNASATYTSATAVFVAADVGKKIIGTNIPANTYVGIINSATSIGLSSSASSNVPVNATATGTSLYATVVNRSIGNGVHVWNGSHSGYQASAFGTTSPNNIWAQAVDGFYPDLIIIEFGINDLSAGRGTANYYNDIVGIVTNAVAQGGGSSGGLGYTPSVVIVPIWAVSNVANQTIPDGVISGGTTLTSPTGQFTTADTGLTVTGIGIPGATTLTYVSPTVATLSAVSTNGAVTYTIVNRKRTDQQWGPYREQMYKAARDNGWAVWDMYNVGGYIGTDDNNITGGNLVHPNDYGAELLSRKMSVQFMEAPSLTNLVSLGTGNAKGDLLVWTADNVADRFPVGLDGQSIVGDSTSVKGISYIGGARVIAEQHADVTVANTVTETALAILTMPANPPWAVGDALRLVAFGTAINNSGVANTAIYGVRIGGAAGTLVASNAAAATSHAAGANRRTWAIYVDFEVATIGASGAFRAGGMLDIGITQATDRLISVEAGGFAPYVLANTVTGIDLTASKDFVFTVKFGAAASTVDHICLGASLTLIKK